jgi:hypothetical protein
MPRPTSHERADQLVRTWQRRGIAVGSDEAEELAIQFEELRRLHSVAYWLTAVLAAMLICAVLVTAEICFRSELWTFGMMQRP